MSTALSTSPSEVLYFDLFRSVTAPAATVFASDFWQRDVLQLAQAEPAMWHAAVAVGALQAAWQAELQGRDGNESDDYQSRTRDAIEHYGKALALASSDPGNPEKMAALSLVLTASANTLGRWAESQLHILASLRLTVPSYADTVMRMDFQAMTFSDSASPYPYDKTTALVDLDGLLQGALGAGELTSYEDASSRFFGLFRAYLMLSDGFVRGDLPQGPFLTRSDAFFRALAWWERCMGRFEGRYPDQQGASASLRLYHCFLRFLVHAGPFGRETKFDRCLGHFEYMVRLAAVLRASRSSILSLEPGLIVPLYTVAHRCRHPGLRRHALKMLRGLDSLEGNWRSEPAARVLDRLIAVEETGLEEHGTDFQLDEGPPASVPWQAWSKPGFEPPTAVDRRDIVVPEGNRVRDVCAMADLHERRITLRFLMCSPNDTDPLGPVREDVAYF